MPLSLTRFAQTWSRRLLFVLACLQVVSPSVAAVVDGWRGEARAPLAHVEEPGSTGCVVVHDSDCLLCAIATGDDAPPPLRPVLPAVVAIAPAPATRTHVPLLRPRPVDSLSRAPPRSIA